MTHLDPDNIAELAAIAREVGAEVLSGHLRYPSDTGGWQLGDIDLSEYLARHRDRRLVLILAPVSDAEPMTYTCGICGYVMERAEECLHCRREVEQAAREILAAEERDVLDQVRDLLDGETDGE